MVTLRMEGCITLEELMLNNCFEKGQVLDRQTNLDFLVL